jgi:hypothetical protein
LIGGNQTAQTTDLVARTDFGQHLLGLLGGQGPAGTARDEGGAGNGTEKSIAAGFGDTDANLCARAARAPGLDSRRGSDRACERLLGSRQLLSEGRRKPAFVAFGRPASVADEKAIDLRRHQRVDQVGCVALSQSGLECVGSSK